MSLPFLLPFLFPLPRPFPFALPLGGAFTGGGKSVSQLKGEGARGLDGCGFVRRTLQGDEGACAGEARGRRGAALKLGRWEVVNSAAVDDFRVDVYI